MLVIENKTEICRICNFLKCTEEEVYQMYTEESLDTKTLLRWSKLLGYDFFRLYSQHLILYSPQARSKGNPAKIIENTDLPEFRKNIYTRELIDFVIDLVTTERKTKLQIIEEYGIPKTTLYKWIAKYVV